MSKKNYNRTVRKTHRKYLTWHCAGCNAVVSYLMGDSRQKMYCIDCWPLFNPKQENPFYVEG